MAYGILIFKLLLNMDRLEEIQRQYFDFCTELIKSSSPEKTDQESLMTKAFYFQHELEKEIIKKEIGLKNKSLKEVELEIDLLKTYLRDK